MHFQIGIYIRIAAKKSPAMNVNTQYNAVIPDKTVIIALLRG